MSEHAIKPVPKPTFGNLAVMDLRDFKHPSEVKNYSLPDGVAGGELYYTSKTHRQTAVSAHFKVADFARSRTETYDYARIHSDLVYELEKIRAFFGKDVHIVTGYMSDTYLSNQTYYTDIAVNHVAGLAARIRIRGVTPLILAKFAIVVGKPNTWVSVGDEDVIIAVNQTKKNPEELVSTHIGRDGPTRRRQRLSREKALAILQKDFLWFQRGHRHLLTPLDKHYQSLKSSALDADANKLIRRDPGSGQFVFRPPGYGKHLSQQRDIIIVLHRTHSLSVSEIVAILFYSDYYTMYRTFYRLEAHFKTNTKNLRYSQYLYMAAAELGTILCPEIKVFREKSKTPGVRNLRYPMQCLKRSDSHKIPITRRIDRFDDPLWSDLTNFVQSTVKGLRTMKKVQDLPVLGHQTRENHIDARKPDRPDFDITGRYEAHQERADNDRDLIGQTLVINQAGTHIQGVHAYLRRPPKERQQYEIDKGYWDFHGDEDGGEFIALYYDPAFAEFTIKIKPKLKNALEVTIVWPKSRKLPNGYEEVLTFRRVDERPTNISLDLPQATPLVRLTEWSPLLQLQRRTISDMFSGRRLKSFDKYLNAYWNPVSITDKPGEQVDSAKALDKLFQDAFMDRNQGIHYEDNVQTAFYISALLSMEKWSPSGLDTLNRFDYLRMMVEQEQMRGHSSAVYHSRIFLNLPELGDTENRMLHEYKVSIDLHGVGAKYGPGANAFLGDLTITKTKGDQNWPVDANSKFVSSRYSVVLVGIAAGVGLNFRIKGSTMFSSYTEWLPGDFPGWGDLVRVSLSASTGPAKAGGSDFFVTFTRGKGTFMADFSKGGFGLKKSGKFAVEGELSYNLIRISHAPSTRARPALKASEIQKDYSLRYDKKTQTFNGFDSAILTEDGRQRLRWMAASELPVLMEKDTDIRVEGFTDRVGTDDYNKKLAMNRAENVKLALRDILGKRLKIADKDIDATSLGEKLARNAGDLQDEENPRFRGVRILINGRVVLRLLEAYGR